jgi:hypothetical protein
MTDDKRELLKLKQGLTDKQDSPLEVDKPPVYEKPTGWAAVSNFVYHHKIHLSMGVFFVTVASVFLYFALTDDKPDITVLFIADTHEASAFLFAEGDELQSAIEVFTSDFNGDGKILAKCLFIDLVKEGRSAESIHGNSTKLFGEVQGNRAYIYVGNRQALENIPQSADMPVEDFYEGFFRVSETVLTDYTEFNFVEAPEDLYITIRKTADDESLSVFRLITDGLTQLHVE